MQSIIQNLNHFPTKAGVTSFIFQLSTVFLARSILIHNESFDPIQNEKIKAIVATVWALSATANSALRAKKSTKRFIWLSLYFPLSFYEGDFNWLTKSKIVAEKILLNEDIDSFESCMHHFKDTKKHENFLADVAYKCNNEKLAKLFSHHPLLKDNETLFHKLVSKNGLLMKHAGFGVLENEEISKSAIEQNPFAIQYVPERFRQKSWYILGKQNIKSMIDPVANFDKQVFSKECMEYFSDDKAVLRKILEIYPDAIQWIALDHTIYSSLALGACSSQNAKGSLLKHIHKSLFEDTEFLRGLATNNEDLFATLWWSSDTLNMEQIAPSYLHDLIQSAKGTLIKYLIKNPCSNPDQNLRTLERWAVLQDGLSLQYLTIESRGNKEIVQQAINQNSLAFIYISAQLQQDIKYVRELFNKNIDKLSVDKKCVLFMVKLDGNYLERASKALQDDIDVVLAAVRQNGMALKFASEKLKENKIVVMEALGQDGKALEYVGNTMKRLNEVVMKALMQNEDNDLWHHIPKETLNDPIVSEYFETASERIDLYCKNHRAGANEVSD